MKFRNSLFSFFLLISTSILSQKFSYKLASTSGMNVKTKGVFIINDTLMLQKDKNQKLEFSISKTFENKTIKQFKVLDLPGDKSTRVTLSKQKPYTLVLESRDDFSNSLVSITYFLTKEDEK